MGTTAACQCQTGALPSRPPVKHEQDNKKMYVHGTTPVGMDIVVREGQSWSSCSFSIVVAWLLPIEFSQGMARASLSFTPQGCSRLQLCWTSFLFKPRDLAVRSKGEVRTCCALHFLPAT